MQKLQFQNSKGNNISAIISDPTGDKGNPIIILCHGFTSNKNTRTWLSLESILNEKGISTFRFDIFGHGESDGKFEKITLSETVDDILKAIEYLKGLGYSRIGLIGSSFGGMASMLTASQTDDLYVLALKSPVSNYMEKILAERTHTELGEWNKNGFIDVSEKYGRPLILNYTFVEDAKKHDGYESAKKIKIPTLIVHGDKDVIVPIEQSKKTASIIKDCKLEIIEGAGHDYNNPEHFKRIIKLIADFIIEKS